MKTLVLGPQKGSVIRERLGSKSKTYGYCYECNKSIEIINVVIEAEEIPADNEGDLSYLKGVATFRCFQLSPILIGDN